MFTDRFIKVPIKVYDKKQAELIGKEEYEDSWVKINPFEISQYKSTVDAEMGDTLCTYVSMKNGDGFNVYLTIEEFENLLNGVVK